MRVPQLVVVGELNADIVLALDVPPVFGQAEQIVRSADVVLGSSSAITACGAAKMAVPTSLVSVVGDDALGHLLVDELRAMRVDVSATRIDSAMPTGVSTILALPTGDRSMLTAMGTIGAVTSADVPDRLLVPGAHLHVGSYYLQHGLHDHLDTFLARCRSQGLTTSLDPNDDPGGEWNSRLEEVLPHVDVFLCNLDECRAIARADDIEAAEDWFAERLPAGAELVVKLGADGARVAVMGDARVSVRHQVRAPSVPGEFVDTVGAGDSLAAGYIAARLRGRPLDYCLRVGVANGTASTRGAGGTAAQLTWDEAAALSSDAA